MSVVPLRIVFFGTPDFAVASLRALVEAGHQVVGVVTAPDKPAGRGQQMQVSAVGQYAGEQGLPLLQPPKLKDGEFLQSLQNLQADLHIVVAFRMLPEAVWAMPRLGTVNVHASLLPQYRGAAPINWALMNGEEETGVTTFQLQQQIDTGAVLLQQIVPILPADNAGTLHDRLMDAGAALLLKTVAGLAAGELVAKPQTASEAEIKHAPKIFKPDCAIDWNLPAETVHNKIRGLAPHPAAFAQLEGKALRIFESRFEGDDQDVPAGQWDTDGKTYLRARAQDGWLWAEAVQLDGKKRMKIGEFLRGYRFTTL
jgi:methionyl-tRNA formyltransferase